MAVRIFETRVGKDLNYIECAGVRVPADWTIDQLRKALAKRNIRFSNEQDAIAVYGAAIEFKVELERRIDELNANVARLYVEAQNLRAEMVTIRDLQERIERLNAEIDMLRRSGDGDEGGKGNKRPKRVRRGKK